MTPRERVLAALKFEPTDRVPIDLGGMPSTCISCFAYPGLVAALGLPPRPPRVHDVGQMLALPDTDVLDALDCDVVTIQTDITNAYPQPRLWFDYDFNGRLAAQVQHPDWFQALPDGTIVLPRFERRMPPQSHVFEEEHGGQPIALDGDIPKPDLRQLKEELEANRLTEQAARNLIPHFHRGRESTDRAILFCGYGAGIGIGNFGGLAIFPMLCLAEPEFVRELHDLVIRYSIQNARTLLGAVGPYIDIYQCCSDDWGTQSQTIASPDVFRSLFKPYYQRFTAAIRSSAPNVKTFLHSCGAIYDILDDIIDCGFDVLNPVPNGRPAGIPTPSGKTSAATESPCGAAASMRKARCPLERPRTSSGKLPGLSRACGRAPVTSSTASTTSSPRSRPRTSWPCTGPLRKTGTDSLFGSLKSVSVPAFCGSSAIVRLFHRLLCPRFSRAFRA